MYYRGSAAAIVVYDITNQVRSISEICFTFIVFNSGSCDNKSTFICVFGY